MYAKLMSKLLLPNKKNTAPSALHRYIELVSSRGKKHNKRNPQRLAWGQNQRNGENKHAYAPKAPMIPPASQEGSPAKDSILFMSVCETGHLERNCPRVLSRVAKEKKNADFRAWWWLVLSKGCIFEIDLSNSYANENSIYTVSNKRAKLDLDSALLWHCRLGHISKKRIEKLQHDGLLNSTNLRAFEKCVPCMSGRSQENLTNISGKGQRLTWTK
ncbi:retrotransposon protein, putative, ty1-copia subclass [Tanacetum coccineum]